MMPLVFVLAVVLVMAWLLRSRVLKVKYTVWWAVVALFVLVFALVPRGLEAVSRLAGFEAPSNFVFFAGLLLILVISVQLSLELSRSEEKVRRLAEEHALLSQAVDQLRGQLAGADRPVSDEEVEPPRPVADADRTQEHPAL